MSKKVLSVDDEIVSKKYAPAPGNLFALTAGALGLIVDLAAFVALLSGTIKLPEGNFLADSPVALAVFTYFSMLYSIILILYFGRSLVDQRWRAISWAPNPQVENDAILILAALLWVPAFWLWSVVIWRAGAAAGYPFEVGSVFVLFWILNMIGGAAALSNGTKTLHRFLNPAATVPPRR